MLGKIGVRLYICVSCHLPGVTLYAYNAGLMLPCSTLLHIELEHTKNRPNQEILVPDWLITGHVTYITSSDWLFTKFGRFLEHNKTNNALAILVCIIISILVVHYPAIGSFDGTVEANGAHHFHSSLLP